MSLYLSIMLNLQWLMIQKISALEKVNLINSQVSITEIRVAIIIGAEFNTYKILG